MKQAFLAPDGRLRSGWRFVLAILVFILANIAGATLASAVAQPRSQTFEIFFRSLSLLLLVAGYWWMSVRLDRVPAPTAYLGLSADVSRARQTIVGFIYGAALVSVAVAIMATMGSVSLVSRLSPEMLLYAVVQFAIFAAAAMLEEVAFRGYPFHRLIEGLGPVGAILVANVLFGLLHIGNPEFGPFAMLNTFLVGIPFAIAYLLTRALWLPWGFHWGWNFTLGVLYGLPVSGLDFSGPVRGYVSGPEWLTGGKYGIEAGAAGTIVIIVGLAGIFWVARQPALVGRRPPESGNLPPAAGIQA